jgi:MFS family permease
LALLSDFRALDRRVFILAAARLVVTLGFSAVLPYLGVTLHKERGVSLQAVGAIWTAAGLSGAAMQWVAGEITDRVGRRPVLISAMLIRTVNLAALGYQIIHQGPILSIAALVILNGILRAFFDPVASAMVADLSRGEHRVAAFSLQRIGVNIGWAMGTIAPALLPGGGLAYGYLFYVSAVITLLATGAASAIAETRATVATSVRPPFRLADVAAFRHDRRFMGFLLATFFFFLLQAQLYAPLSLYAADHLHMGIRSIRHLYLENGIIVIFLQLPAFYYIRRVGNQHVLVLGALAYAASYALCGLATREAHLVACVALVTLAEIISAPAQQTAATTMAPHGRIGAYAGLFGLAQAAGQSFGPLVGTSLLAGLPARLTWPLVAMFGVVSAVLYGKTNHGAPEASTPAGK